MCVIRHALCVHADIRIRREICRKQRNPARENRVYSFPSEAWVIVAARRSHPSQLRLLFMVAAASGGLQTFLTSETAPLGRQVFDQTHLIKLRCRLIRRLKRRLERQDLGGDLVVIHALDRIQHGLRQRLALGLSVGGGFDRYDAGVGLEPRRRLQALDAALDRRYADGATLVTSDGDVDLTARHERGAAR